MSLDKIQLPDFLLPALFKDSLVVTDELKVVPTPPKTTAPPPAPTEKVTIAPPKKLFLGDNKKNISILVKDSDAVYLREEWLQFLTNILAACKLNMGDVAIINLAQNKVTFSELQTSTTPKYIITFDIEATEIALPFTIPTYQVQEFNNCTLLLCPTLSVMFGDSEAVKLEKTKLWMSLKRMFGL